LTRDRAFSDAGIAKQECADAWSELAHAAASESLDINRMTATAALLPALELEALDQLAHAAISR
jgi:hypothetical protein